MAETLRPLLDRSAAVAVLHVSTQVRLEAAACVRQLGFGNVLSFDSADELKRHLKKHKVDWLLASPVTANGETILPLLQFLLADSRFRDIGTSVLIEPGDRAFLPLAFENGLMSWHDGPFTRDKILPKLAELLRLAGRLDMDPTRVAAHYLRDHCVGAGLLADLVALERGLVRHYAKDPSQLLRLAKALLGLGREVEGLAVLDRVVQDFPGEKTTAAAVYQQHVDQLKSSKKGFELGVRTAVVVDPDEASRRLVEDVLHSLKVAEVHGFSAGDEAWAWLHGHPEPGLIIQEWRIPRVSGPQLLQRVRARGHVNVPIVIASSLVGQADLPLLNEMSVANVVAKPIGKRELLLALGWTLSQDREPSEQKSLERGILRWLEAGNIAHAQLLRSKWDLITTIAAPRRLYMDAEFAYARGQYEKSKDLVSQSLLAAGRDPLNAVNLLGKCLMKLGDIEAALQCLNKAQAISPANVQRLVTIAELEIERGDLPKANLAIEKARALDGGFAPTIDVEAARAVMSDDVKAAKQLMSDMGSLEQMFRFLNNRAVSLARLGRTSESLKLYQKLLDTLPEKHAAFRSIVAFNMAIANIRAGSLRVAWEHARSAEKDKASRVYGKAQSLSRRLKEAIDAGRPFLLAPTPGTDVIMEDDDADLYERFDSRVGKPVQPVAPAPKASGLARLSGLYRHVATAAGFKDSRAS